MRHDVVVHYSAEALAHMFRVIAVVRVRLPAVLTVVGLFVRVRSLVSLQMPRALFL